MLPETYLIPIDSSGIKVLSCRLYSVNGLPAKTQSESVLYILSSNCVSCKMINYLLFLKCQKISGMELL